VNGVFIERNGLMFFALVTRYDKWQLKRKRRKLDNIDTKRNRQRRALKHAQTRLASCPVPQNRMEWNAAIAKERLELTVMCDVVEESIYTLNMKYRDLSHECEQLKAKINQRRRRSIQLYWSHRFPTPSH
jgi:chromosome segregation ATPase